MVIARPKSANLGGRPPKFDEPSRPVTVTLPDRTLRELSTIDPDRAKAIVKSVDAVIGAVPDTKHQIEMVEMAPGLGLLIVPPNESLRALPWLKMIEVAPTRHLLLIDPGTPIEKVEVTLNDMIDDLQETAPHEAAMLLTLREHLVSMRRGGRLTKAELLCVSTDE